MFTPAFRVFISGFPIASGIYPSKIVDVIDTPTVPVICLEPDFTRSVSDCAFPVQVGV